MISVNNLYLRVNNDLARKSKGGYSANDEFNRDMVDAQELIYSYYYGLFEVNGRTMDSLSNFVQETEFNVNGSFPYPDDYRHKIDAKYVSYASASECGSPVSEIETVIKYINADEEYDLMSSAIRRPSLEKKRLYYTQYGNAFRLLPKSMDNKVRFKYLRQPRQPNRAVTLDLVNDEEVYDEPNSTQLEWPQQEFNNFVSVMLYFKGIQVRETALINWVAQRKGITMQNMQ